MHSAVETMRPQLKSILRISGPLIINFPKIEFETQAVEKDKKVYVVQQVRFQPPPPGLLLLAPADLFDLAAQRLDLATHQVARRLGAGGIEPGRGHYRRVATVSGAEGVVHVVGEAPHQIPGERVVVLLLSGMEAEILEEHHVVSFEEFEPVFDMVNEIEVPFIMTDNSGRPILWNEPVIGIPVLDLRGKQVNGSYRAGLLKDRHIDATIKRIIKRGGRTKRRRW